VEFSKDLRDAVTSGDVTVSFRLWRRPKVRPGGRYRAGPAQIEAGSVELMPLPPLRQATSAAAENATGNPCASGPPTPARSLTTHCFTGRNSTWPGLRQAKSLEMNNMLNWVRGSG
jgi:hypothetical protein